MLLGLLWLGCTSDLPVVPPPPPSPVPPPVPPPSPVKVAFQGEPQDGSTDAALAPFRVAVLDAHDSVVARDSINITVRLAANPDSATLRGTLTVPTRAGIAEFSDVWIDHAAQGYRVIAEASALSSDTSSAFSMVAPKPIERSVIAASGGSTCALDPSGAAWCWGDNVLGELGEGRLFSSQTPLPIIGNLRFSQIAVYPGLAGVIDGPPYDGHEERKIACGLTVSGVIYCWGGAGSAFGDGGTPKAISGSRTFLSIGIGANDDGVCGLASDGTVWCWESGAQNGPTQVPANVRFVSLSSGSGRCGLTAAGRAYCWGRGYLGNGQYSNSDTVVAVSGDHVFRAIASGWSHYAGIDDAGVAWTWGSGDHAFLGDSSGARQALVPVRVRGNHDFRSITTGYTTCAIDGDGSMWCWGDTVRLVSGAKFAMVSLAADARVGSCYLTSDGEAWCGGVRVETTERFAWISTGDRATCAITTGGEGRCWGSNYAGQLADGHPLRSPVPLRVLGGKTFESLFGGGSATCGVTVSDETWCWGTPDSVGARSTPTRLVGDPRLKTMSLANEGGCGIDANRQGWCWGYGRSVATGDPWPSAGKPVAILGDIHLSAIAVGVQACALTTGGDVYCAGPGIGTSWSLTLLSGGPRFVALSGGLEVHCALTAAGDGYCWSYFDHHPILLPGGLRFATISADGSADGGLACGVTTEGKGYCWHGSGGYLSPYVLHAPEPVPGDLTFTRIDLSHAGGGHVCGTTPDGTIYCWGANSRGQLGNGQVDTATVTVPTPVIGLKARH
ncbi:MAG TPA: hypothetical protein VG454_09235 [Gemmatimonadales bacterium]|nr:hypothetical protein [Gemmatimonadales bacterium]